MLNEGFVNRIGVPQGQAVLQKLANSCLLVGLLCASLLAAQASADILGPRERIEQATESLVSEIIAAKGYYADDPEKFHAKIDTIITPLVDFRSFSRSVMGRYGSKKYYRSLPSDAERNNLKKQARRFQDRFRTGLVATYAKGLITFSGENINVLPLSSPAEAGKSATVEQHISGDGGKPIIIKYKMRQNKQQEWMIRNVTIQSVNLGKVYRSQFSSAARLHKGNVDKVVDEWAVGSVDIES